MNREGITTILKGMWIGGTMTVPGVSGEVHGHDYGNIRQADHLGQLIF